MSELQLSLFAGLSTFCCQNFSARSVLSGNVLPFWTHSGLDGLQQQDGLFISAGGLSELLLPDQRVALHVEERHRLKLLVFFHHPRLAVVGHGVSHLDTAKAGREKNKQALQQMFSLILFVLFLCCGSSI